MSEKYRGLNRSAVKFWDKFLFVGNSYDGRKIWAVGDYDDEIVAETTFQGDLTLDNLPDDAVLYPQRFLSGRAGMILHKSPLGGATIIDAIRR